MAAACHVHVPGMFVNRGMYMYRVLFLIFDFEVRTTKLNGFLMFAFQLSSPHSLCKYRAIVLANAIFAEAS